MKTNRAKDETKLTRGWAAIAQALHVDVKTAKKYASRADRPLPVRVDHVGPYAESAAIDTWMESEDRSYHEYLSAQTAPELRATA